MLKLVLIIVVFFNFFLSFYVISQDRKSWNNRLFFLLSFFAAIWTFTNYLTGVYSTPFWLQSTYAFGALVISTGLIWTLLLTDKFLDKKKIALILFIALFFFFGSFWDGFIAEKYEKIYLGGAFVGEPGIGLIIYALFFLAAGALILYKLFSAQRKEADKKIKKRLLYIFYGALGTLIISSLTSFIFPLFSIFSFSGLDSIGFLIFLFFIAYAITKQGLFNIKVIATELLVFAIWVFLFIRLLLSNTLQDQLINGGLLTLVIVSGILLIRSVMKEISQREEVAKLNENLSEVNLKLNTRTKYLAALQDFTTSIIESLDFQNTIQSIVNGVSNRFGYLGALLILVSKDGEKIYPAAISKSAASSVVLRILPKPLEEYFEFIGQTSSLTAETIKRGEIQFSGDFSEIFSSVPKDILSRIQKTTGIRLTIAIPIKSKGNILGALEVITAKTKADISQEELDVLKTLANQIGIVLDNASLFEETKKLSSYKTELLSIVAHQLKNPLVVVKGYSSLVEDNTIQGVDAMKEVFKKVKGSADKLINLLNNLLDLHHIEDGKMHYEFQKLELNKLLKDISDNFQLILAQRKLQFTFEPFAKDANVSGDIYKLSQVFQNLIDNAIKYTEAGWIKVKIIDEKDSYIVEISDSGRGISQDLITKLFQKFSRGVEEKQILGTGLGLYISKEIVEAHRGKVWAESEGEGKGSKFIVKLPRAE